MSLWNDLSSETYFQLPQWFYSLYYKCASVFSQKDKPAFQTQLVESYHIKNSVQPVQETDLTFAVNFFIYLTL